MATHALAEPLLELSEVSRIYANGGVALTVLSDINLRIAAGEMLAIVGASGSGKSTLLNLLGCLDQPSTGIYRVEGQATRELQADALAQLRREHFGFVFQHYQLLADLSALGNVETPAIYARQPRAARHERAQALLVRLGLQDRLQHRPGQLSGGQQQRVSIARALMNGGQVILADEPTGALDSQSGEELMRLLVDLNADGHTVVIVTHDQRVAQYARRIIEMKDGCIIADRSNPQWQENNTATTAHLPSAALPPQLIHGGRWMQFDGLLEVLRLALRSAAMHRLRTFLTMLGIIIGIASVVCVVALGEGSRQRILGYLNDFGTNTIDVYPGRMPGDQRAGTVHTLSIGDVAALRAQDYIDSATPMVSTSSMLRYRDVAVNATVNGVGEAFFRVHGVKMAEGVAFDTASVASQAQEAVIDEKTRLALFHGAPAIGATILVGVTACRVIGVAAPGAQDRGDGGMLQIWLPYSSVMTRLTGQFNLQSISLRIADAAPADAAVDGVTALLKRRHGRQDFNTFNSAALRTLVTQTNESISLLLSAIAFISLLVGGIGVMNIMLVSVTERTREIGVRMAVGARKADIRNQFLMEAVLICLLGGALGVGLALGIGLALSRPGSHYTMVFSITSMLAAFASATLIGIVFGFMPARQAARLKPVDALARE